VPESSSAEVANIEVANIMGFIRMR
jgi:hypothetical protein